MADLENNPFGKAAPALAGGIIGSHIAPAQTPLGSDIGDVAAAGGAILGSRLGPAGEIAGAALGKVVGDKLGDAISNLPSSPHALDTFGYPLGAAASLATGISYTPPASGVTNYITPISYTPSTGVRRQRS